MSRTIKNKPKRRLWKSTGNKIPAYAGKGKIKHKPSAYEYRTGYDKRISKAAKLEAKNANRAAKKAVRQKVKKEINNELTKPDVWEGWGSSDYSRIQGWH